jgi:hypothetical protein
MTLNAGVWIDGEHAVIVLLSEPEPEIIKLTAATAAEQSKSAAGGRTGTAFTKNDFVAEDRLKRKSAARRKRLFGDVVAALDGVERLLVVGPGVAKNEFHKTLTSKKGKLTAVELQTSDKLTDRGLAAHVRKFFKVNASDSTTKRPTTRKKSLTRRSSAARSKV